MNATELTAALDTVVQDHRLVLEKMQAFKGAVSCLLDPRNDQVPQTLSRLWESNEYFATQFEAHLEEEERALFPFLERQPEGAALVGRLRRDHTEIRRLRDEFGKCLAVACEVEGHPPRMVLRDTMAYGWELWGLLDDHAHREAQAVHQATARCLQEVGP
jgi:hypothetical protein